MLRVLTDEAARAELARGLDEIVREGARRMLVAALEAEVDAYVGAFSDERDDQGHRLVTRNGHAQARTITTAAGGIEIEAPRVNTRGIDDGTGQRRRFASVIVPPWCPKSPKVTKVLPLMYLHGMSWSDFAPALEELTGPPAEVRVRVADGSEASDDDVDMVGALSEEETGPAGRDPLVDVVADLVRPGLILD